MSDPKWVCDPSLGPAEPATQDPSSAQPAMEPVILAGIALMVVLLVAAVLLRPKHRAPGNTACPGVRFVGEA